MRSHRLNVHNIVWSALKIALLDTIDIRKYSPTRSTRWIVCSCLASNCKRERKASKFYHTEKRFFIPSLTLWGRKRAGKRWANVSSDKLSIISYNYSEKKINIRKFTRRLRRILHSAIEGFHLLCGLKTDIECVGFPFSKIFQEKDFEFADWKIFAMTSEFYRQSQFRKLSRIVFGFLRRKRHIKASQISFRFVSKNSSDVSTPLLTSQSSFYSQRNYPKAFLSFEAKTAFSRCFWHVSARAIKRCFRKQVSQSMPRRKWSVVRIDRSYHHLNWSVNRNYFV